MDEMLLETLAALESRLQRLEFVINGGTVSEDKSGTKPVAARLQTLEEGLQKMATKSPLVHEVLNLQSRYPTHFHPPPKPEETAADLDTSHRLAMVLSEAPSYHSTASQLTALADSPIPSTQAFTTLLALQPRMADIYKRQVEQAVEISALRKKSGIMILAWHELFILGQGRCWAEWDTRLRNAERTVRREEVRRTMEKE